MKVNSQNFAVQFGARAAKVLAEQTGTKLAETAPKPPQDSFLGKLGRVLGFKPSPQVRSSQQSMGIQAAFKALHAPAALALAQEVGVETAADGDPAGSKFRAKMADKVDNQVDANQKMDQVWSKIVSVTGDQLERPTLLTSSGSGAGHFVGKSMFAHGDAFAKLPEEVALFYTAHEVGHIENQDGARKSGMTQLANLVDADPGTLRKARQDKDWEMEHKADERAAEICGQLRCDPVPILKDLLQEPSGSEHPPGMERAKRVRATLAKHGQTVSDTQWSDLVQETARVRAEKQRASDDYLEYKLAFEGLR